MIIGAVRFPPSRALPHGRCTVRPFMKSVFLLFAVVGLCVCAVQAATPAATWGASQTVRASSSLAVAQSTLPTVAGVSADITSTAVSKAATQTSRPATSPTVRTATPRPSTTAARTTAAPTKATTPQPSMTVTSRTTEAPTEDIPAPTAEQNLTVPSPTDSPNATFSTPWPNATTYEYYYPTEYRTQDIDPGMTPYTGPTLLETIEPTPTWEVPANLTNVTPTDPQVAMPYVTAEVVESPTFEIPPGAYGVEPVPSPTETEAPFPISGSQDVAGSSFLPRWLSYLLFIFLGISGVAGIALVGSYAGLGPSGEPAVGIASTRSAPSQAREVRLLQPGAPEPTMEQQVLIDRIERFVPQSMHVERLGRNLLRFEHGAQASAQDRSIRLGRLLIFSAIPSAPVPAPATAWARTHGFRVLAVDGSGMALVMPALSNGGRSVLGVLPVGEMVEGASPVPMPVLPGESDRGVVSRSASTAGTGIL